jgi:DegV family protein with EDD domain
VNKEINMAVKILVDSSSDISEKEAKELGIEMIPMVITFGEEEFYDGVNLLPIEFYDRLIKSKEMPTTAQVTPFRFEEKFSEMTLNGDDVVAIVLSSKLSGTYEGAKMTAEKFGGKVYVVDSLSATGGERLLVYRALELAKQGKSAKEIAEDLEVQKGKICIVAMLETLEYLKKGGRISGAAAFIGGMLNIKPIIQVIDGKVEVVAKVRGQKKAALQIKKIVEENEIDFSKPYMSVWTGTDESISLKYIEDNKDLYPNNDNPASQIIGSTIGTHIGPGVLGFIYFKK